jgi:hypothetical protein
MVLNSGGCFFESNPPCCHSQMMSYVNWNGRSLSSIPGSNVGKGKTKRSFDSGTGGTRGYPPFGGRPRRRGSRGPLGAGEAEGPGKDDLDFLNG